MRLYLRKVKPRSAPAGRHFLTSPPETRLREQKRETNMFLFKESPTNPAQLKVVKGLQIAS